MDSTAKSLVTKLAIMLGFAATVIVNWLATTSQINNVSTAAVSDAHPTLLTPQSYTFSIWGIIYLLLLIYVLFQLFSHELGKDRILAQTAIWFVVSCIANIGWLFAWHYEQLIVSEIAIALLLYSLARIVALVSTKEHTFSNMLSLELPFGFYAGWITVATVVNTAVLLLDIGWDGFGIAWFVWLIIVLLMATFIALAATRTTDNIAFPAAMIWGFVGILLRYLPDFKIDLRSATMWIVIILVLCILVLFVRWIDIIARRLK